MNFIISESQLKELKNILKENPDGITVDGAQISSFNNYDAVSFGFYNGKACIGYNDALFQKSNKIDDDARTKISELDNNDLYRLPWHSHIGIFNSFLNNPGLPDDRDDFEFSGRFWYDKKVISFWRYPNKNNLIELLNQISDECYRIYGYNISFDDYKIEIKEYTYGENDDENDVKRLLIPLKDFIGSKDASAEEMSKMHLLPSAEKRKTPQMQAFRKERSEILANKFKNVSQAEWNAARNKYMGESILKETPDVVKVDGKEIASFFDSDALSFGFKGDSAYVSLNYLLFQNSNNFNYEQKNEVYKFGYLDTHADINIFYSRFLGDINAPKNRSDFDYPGRLWLDKKIISFWLYPDIDKITNLINNLSREIYRVYGTKINFKDYYIEIKEGSYIADLSVNDEDYVDDFDWNNNERNGTLIPLKDFIGSKDANAEEMSKMHLLPSDEKRKTNQMQAFRKEGEKILANKFKNVSQAEWNAARSKYMGESIDIYEDINIPVNTGDTVLMGKFKNKKTVVKTIGKDEYNMPTINGKKAATFRMTEVDDGGFNHLNEVESSEVNLSSFEIKKELNNKFWDNKKLNYKVRRRLLKIADDFLEFVNVDSKYCKDILFLGSLSNYNWSKYSDIDLHLLIDLAKINKDTELVKDYFDAKRKIWNDEHETLKIYGFPVELYIQDINEKNASTSVFSLEKNKWIKIPKEDQEEELDKNKIKQKSADVMTKIDNLKEKYDKNPKLSELENISKKVKTLFDEIKKLRKSGLESDNGEFSVGNIVFKVLRRSGHMEILIDLKRNTYDKINTIK